MVAFLITNRAEIVETYFALARTGIVGLPLNYRLVGLEIYELMGAMNAKGLIFEARFFSVAEKATALKHLIQIDGDRLVSRSNMRPCWRRRPESLPDNEIDENDPYYFNLTSGTTGLPTLTF